MPEVLLRAGIDPDEPDEVLLAVVIDPDGSPGEQAVAELGDLSAVMEDDGVCYVLRTDAWADARIEDEVLTVDILIYEAVLEHRGVDVSVFPDRSPRDPEAVRVLRVTGTTTHDTVPPATLVYLSPLDEIEDDELPLLLAPPPQPPEVGVRAGLDPDNPEAVHVVVVIDPDETPGEWAVAAVGETCDVDGDSQVVRVAQSVAWAESRLDDGELTVDILVNEKRLRKIEDIDLTVSRSGRRMIPRPCGYYARPARPATTPCPTKRSCSRHRSINPMTSRSCWHHHPGPEQRATRTVSRVRRGRRAEARPTSAWRSGHR